MHKYANFLIAVIAILVVVLIAVLYWCVWSNKARKSSTSLLRTSRSTDRFLLGDPATPRVQTQMGDMQAILTALVGVGGSFNLRTKGLANQMNGRTIVALQPVMQARPAVQKIISGLRHASAAVSTLPRTHVNSLSFYRGLCGSDMSLNQFANDIEAEGHEALRRMQTVPPPSKLVSETQILAKDLLRLGDLVRRLVRTCHSLGAALDLE